MATKIKPATQPKIRFLEKPSDYTQAYINNTQLSMTVWDLKLQFGELVSVDPKEIVIQPRVGVSMSPQHAKALAELLTDQVKKYEDSFGEIHVQPRKK